MPFPIVWGIPKGTPEQVLVDLRKAIVANLVETTGCKPSWVRPFFPIDMLEEAVEEAEGCSTIYVSLDTGLFHGKGEDVNERAKEVTQALAQVIWDAFDGEYEVEVFVGNLNNAWKTLLKSRED